jgi:hypothetical protein
MHNTSRGGFVVSTIKRLAVCSESDVMAMGLSASVVEWGMRVMLPALRPW